MVLILAIVVWELKKIEEVKEVVLNASAMRRQYAMQDFGVMAFVIPKIIFGNVVMMVVIAVKNGCIKREILLKKWD